MWVEPIMTLLDGGELPAVATNALIELVEFFVMLVHAPVTICVGNAV